MTGATRSPERGRSHNAAEATIRLALDRARDAGRPLAVLLVAAGDAGRVDRTFGHAAGAQALAALELRLRAAAPLTATIARLGRERIAVADTVDDTPAAIALARELAAVARTPLPGDDVAVRLGATVGVAVAATGTGTAAELLRDADGAAQRARDAGLQPWQLAEAAAREHDVRQLQLEDELAGALERDELALYLQPIVSLHRGAPIGAEALVRWRHPTRGLIGPAQFLPVAEQSGLILQVGDWMLTAAVRELMRWGTGGSLPGLPISLNVSARELRDEAFVERLASALGAARLPPDRLAIELAELGELGEPATAATLHALRGLGVRVVLDRFGGGGTALAHLAQLPFDGLKLDRSLLGPASGDGEAPIVAAVVELAHGLGLAITAPGIETERQLEIVRALHVDAAQGHLIARPAPAGTGAGPGALSRRLAIPVRADGAGARPDGAGAWLSLSTVAGALGVSPSTVRRLADQGVLPGRRTEGGHRRFRRADVQRVARERRRSPRLRAWDVPEAALPATADLLEQQGPALAERAARALYEPGRAGWFAAPQGLARSRPWLSALVVALATGRPRDAIAATVAYADAAALGGASTPEVVRFAGQFAAVATHELLRARTAGDEARALQRLMSAASEAFLERLAP